ncbi:spray [Hirsutella rhossiliensis]|uniref:Spray n=1 Tax=Hirsutella rhossiliensis TaxID=111463 RepID=A0A9P8MV13_9HYPO|nr:spray [Hirsutella rhossiliensis]KAH0961922.1 spray [Hirsutella rhossiliensis]
MDHLSEPGREPSRQSDALDGGPLRHYPSNISALSDAGFTPYDPTLHSQQNLRGRESLISIDSRHEADPGRSGGGSSYDPSPAWPGSSPYTGAAGGTRFAPVRGSVLESFASRTLSRGRRKSSRASLRPQNAVPASIEEEEYDLSLLRSAAPLGQEPRYNAIPEEEPAVPIFDVTSALGPMDSHDADFIKKLQEQEAQGTLTGGLGQGFAGDSRLRLRDSELLSSPMVPSRSLTRSFTRRRSVKAVGRAETIREAGQGEANRRGQVVEVVLEEPMAGADLSNMEGSSMLYGPETRRSSLAAKGQVTQVFYPQPDWKPFSMRWPYLSMLILLSVALAAMQELLYRTFRNKAIASFHSPHDVEPSVYFAVKFAPSICAVLYGVLWQFTDFEVRRLEAFYQLSREGGALAAESINVDYVTSYNMLRPLRALGRRHYAVALSSVATILAVSVVPTCAAACIVMSPGRSERMSNPDAEKFLHLSAIWSRLLTATLVICAVLGAALFYMLQSRRSGLLADVRGIAGLASMAVVSHILMDFKDMDTAKHSDIHLRLKHNRYMLRNSSLAPDDENPASSQERDRYQETHLSENPHPLMLRPAGWVPFVVGSLALTAFIPTFLFTGAAVVADRAPWLLTASAVCLKLSWNAMETAVRVMEPFYILSRRHAPARTLMLDYTALPFGYLPLRALFNGHALVVMVGLGSVMAELLTILVTGLATVDGQEFLGRGNGRTARPINSGQETAKSFYLSFGLSMFILVYMTGAGCVVFARRRHPFLPRQPNTIASVLAYIHQSKMLYDFVGTAKLSKAETARRLNGGGRRYGLGWFEGRDGQTHCGVDQEELTSNYKHGVDYSQRNQPWNVRWDVF